MKGGETVLKTLQRLSIHLYHTRPEVVCAFGCHNNRFGDTKIRRKLTQTQNTHTQVPWRLPGGSLEVYWRFTHSLTLSVSYVSRGGEDLTLAAGLLERRKHLLLDMTWGRRRERKGGGGREGGREEGEGRRGREGGEEGRDILHTLYVV